MSAVAATTTTTTTTTTPSLSQLNAQLFAAAAAGRTSLCIALLEAQASVSAHDDCVASKRKTALLHAIDSRHTDTALALLRANANPNQRGKNGWSALHFAAFRDAALCRPLVDEFGADVHAVDAFENTALIYAAIAAEPDACVTLLNSNANPDTTNESGQTALQICREYGGARVTKVAPAIRAWLKDRDAAAAFARGTMHARRTRKKQCWTDSKLFDKHLIGEITSFVTPP
jgi:hypothetical protein